MINVKAKCDTKKIYYVYEWYIAETNEVFYVGKGKGNRFLKKSESSRNKLFMQFIQNYNCKVRKIIENLDEYSACEYEEDRIINLKNKGECLANIYNRTSLSGHNYGGKNGFYGKKHSDGYYMQLSKRFKESSMFLGKNNSQYGIPLRKRMSEEVYECWKTKHKERMSGIKNTQFGISVKERMIDEEGYKKFCKSCSRGNMNNNPNAKPIIMFDNNGNMQKFFCIKECAEFLIEQKYTNAKTSAVQSSINMAIKENKAYLGFKFEKVIANEL